MSTNKSSTIAPKRFRDRVSLLLSNLEEGRQVRTYMKAFSRADGGCFAVIKIGGALMAEDAEPLAERLALLQAMRLKPIVVYGAGPQLDRELAAAGVVTERVDGLRVTPGTAMRPVAHTAAATGMTLVNALSAAGGQGILAPPSLVRGKIKDEAKYGRVGDATGVDDEALAQILDSDAIPLVSCVVQDELGGLLNINADEVAREIARAVVPPKIVFLTSTGGLLNEAGEVVDTIHTETDYETLIAQPWIHSGMEVKLRQIKELLDELPPMSSVSMTRTENMMQELFTYGGAGTLIRRGERFVETTDVDRDALGALIEEAFGRRLRADYWEGQALDQIIHSERMRAAAIVTRHEGHPYLDKFVVKAGARGEGLAKSLWRRLNEKYPTLLWRSRTNNPFNAFYTANADGFIRRGEWHILWLGEAMGEAALRFADEIAARPHDLQDEL